MSLTRSWRRWALASVMPIWFAGGLCIMADAEPVKRFGTIVLAEAIGLLVLLWLLFPDRFGWVLRLFAAAWFSLSFLALMGRYGLPSALRLLVGVAASMMILIWVKGEIRSRRIVASILLTLALIEAAMNLSSLGRLILTGMEPGLTPFSALLWFIFGGLPCLAFALGWGEPTKARKAAPTPGKSRVEPSPYPWRD